MTNLKYFLSIFRIELLFCVLSTSAMATTKINTFGYSSEYYSITIVDKPPYIKTFSVDGSGKRLLSKNIIKWKDSDSANADLWQISETELEIHRKGVTNKAIWSFKFDKRKFIVKSSQDPENKTDDLTFIFDKHENHVTLLGIMPGPANLFIQIFQVLTPKNSMGSGVITLIFFR